MTGSASLSLAERLRLNLSAKLMRVLLRYFPKDAAILARLGTIELGLGGHAEADRLLRSSLDIDSRQPVIWFHRALALQYLDRREEALQCLKHATTLRRDFAEALELRKALLSRSGQLESGGPRKAKNLKSLKSKDPQELIDSGRALFDSGEAEEALQHFDRAIAIKPDLAPAHNSRGSTLYKLKRYDEALASFDRAIALHPHFAEAYRNRGVVLSTLTRLEEAMQSTERALQLKPQDLPARFNRGHIFMHTNRPREAIADFDQVIAMEPGHIGAHWNKALCLLLTGNLKEGFALHEWRWKKWNLDPATNYGGHLPLWLGENPIEGRTILVAQEQGVGDFIQFCRYVPMIEERGGIVVMGMPTSLMPLVSSLSSKATLVGLGDPLPRCDYVCPILSLPLAFRTTQESIPGRTPYLSVDAARKRTWQERLGPRARLRVGIAWAGNPVHENDRNRSIPLRTLKPLLELPLDFHVLQKDLLADEAKELSSLANVQLQQDELKDFADTGALINEMDIVISVDTAVAHLAGALAKPVWILLPFAPDWRWMLDRRDSPWYPTATLFRQPQRGDWTSVVSELKLRLEELAKGIAPPDSSA